jgi:glycosyltransferase involved in cell wall biosynthesis
MKILILTTEYPPYSGGGIGSLAYELSKGLIKAGNDVVVVTRSSRPSKRGNRVHYLFSPEVPGKDVLYYVVRMRDVRNIAFQEKFDVIHDLTMFSSSQPWITGLAPTVRSVQGSPQIDMIRRMSGLEDNLRNILFNITHRLQPMLVGLLKRPDIRIYVYVSRFAMIDSIGRIRDEALRRKLMERSMVVYNGVDVDALRRIRDEVLKDEGLDGLSLAFIGRLMEYKGVKFLLRAFKRVVNVVHEAKLHIVGDGPIYRDLQELIRKLEIEKNVIMHGSLSRVEAMRILARSALLTHPSLYESFCMAIAEAYAMGKPVVTHRAGYARELVEEPGAGLTVDVLNEEEYANALITLLTDGDLYRKLSKNASSFVENKLNIDTMVRGYMEAYRRAIEG